ncbi:DUF1684 domain-containing protein [Streptomyces fildesensis]|uniref:DUF1684 domain-containing protein n=1 Tax=Streptomyces fildesensis TaxID=375757 RepID=A0ABW8C5J2_9ACTN
MSSETEQDWKNWRERRAESVAAPYGPLALTGTYWLADAEDGKIPGLPGEWREQDGSVVHQGDGDGVFGRLEPEGEPVLFGEKRIVAIDREGLLALRIWDPASDARRDFAGIGAFDYDERWVVPAVFHPYPEGRAVRVPHADGRERGLGVSGELAFTVDGTEHTLAVAVEEDGTLWGVIADATSGRSSYRFRFLRTPAPAADGRVVLDFNRTLLPPCAFADAFVCPFPPPGNTLPFALEAGESKVLTS